MHKFFTEIWDSREDEYGYCYCFETDKAMHRSQYRHLSTVYDHVLEKNKGAYPQYAYTKENIITVLPDVHMQKGVDISKTPKIKVYKEKLMELHYLGKLAKHEST